MSPGRETELPPPRLRERVQARLPGLTLALAVGAAGGTLFHLLGMPLAWMIGSMVFTTVAAVSGAPVHMFQRLRNVMIAVLGVMLGSAFTPDILDHALRWSGSLAALVAYVAIATALCTAYYRRVGGYDPVTAYFAAAPGGLSEMTLVGTAMGGDERAISLSHAARILLIVLIVPFGFRLLGGYRPGGPPGGGIALVAASDIAVLLACGVLGYLLADRARLPAAPLVGPMVLSAATHLFGLTASQPPAEVIAVAQVVVGTAIGCRFVGTRPLVMARAISLACGATLILLAASAACGLALAALLDLPAAGAFLGFAPGGLAEMSLIALALGSTSPTWRRTTCSASSSSSPSRLFSSACSDARPGPRCRAENEISSAGSQADLPRRPATAPQISRTIMAPTTAPIRPAPSSGP